MAKGNSLSGSKIAAIAAGIILAGVAFWWHVIRPMGRTDAKKEANDGSSSTAGVQHVDEENAYVREDGRRMLTNVNTSRSNLGEYAPFTGKTKMFVETPRGSATGRNMGQGIRSCKNLNAWRHFFNPNSPSALQGEIECDIYWS